MGRPHLKFFRGTVPPVPPKSSPVLSRILTSACKRTDGHNSAWNSSSISAEMPALSSNDDEEPSPKHAPKHGPHSSGIYRVGQVRTDQSNQECQSSPNGASVAIFSS